VKCEENMVSNDFRDALGLLVDSGQVEGHLRGALDKPEISGQNSPLLDRLSNSGENMVCNSFHDVLGLLVDSGQVALLMHGGWPH
jgi:hypothetical protein